MFLFRMVVLVIVESKDIKSSQIKYINVREEFTMVAWFPQQVLLLLVLVTDTIPRTTYGIDEPLWSIAVKRKGEKSLSFSWKISPRQKEQSTTSTIPNTIYHFLSNPTIGLEQSIEDQQDVSMFHRITDFQRLSQHQRAMGKGFGLGVHKEDVKKLNIPHSIDRVVNPSVPNSSNQIPLQFAPSQSPALDRTRAKLTIHKDIFSTRKSKSPTDNPPIAGTLITDDVNHLLGSESVSAIEISGIDGNGHTYSTGQAGEEGNVKLNADRTSVARHFSPPRRSLDSTFRSVQFQLEANEAREMLESNKDDSTMTTMMQNHQVENSKMPDNHIESSKNNDKTEVSATSIDFINWKFQSNLLSLHDHEKILSNTAVGFPRRYMRDTPKNACEKFEIGDDVKREFYSPDYPKNYPPMMDCVKVLEADKGMLLKLDFRDVFEMESRMPTNDKEAECRFDYLEVRDGKHGFSTLIKTFCGNNFPPEIISKSRYLWLHFHSDDTIEYKGFKAIWSMVPRPTDQGVSLEQELCFKEVTCDAQAIISSTDAEEEKKTAEKNSVAFDCLWAITAKPGWRMQLAFDLFKLDKPNDCDANFLDVFGERTDMPSRLKNFCGSIAEPVITKTNTVYMRFYLEPKALNSSFETLITAVRDKESNDKPCRPDEYDCDDATCIAAELRCNNRHNCRLSWDEDKSTCGNNKGSLALDSTRIVIILVIFSLIMFGMIFTFGFNCIRKLIRDHRIIREHIRQSRENRLDEIGRKATPCPISASRTDIHRRDSDTPTLELDSNKDLISSTTFQPQDYSKELVLEMKYNSRDANDIHQSNNVSNATQERLQESTDEPEMCDSSCQTRESLFDPHISNPIISSPGFTTFGCRSMGTSQNSSGLSSRRTPPIPQSYRPSPKHSHKSTPIARYSSEQCQSCCPTTRDLDIGSTPCPRHDPIPAPPGWSVHEPAYINEPSGNYIDTVEYPSYRRFHSPDPEQDRKVSQVPGIIRQTTVGSGERYGSCVFGSGRESSNAPSHNSNNESQQSGTPKFPTTTDPRYRAEAVIEVEQKKHFSIESTKSAPDVIATH